MIQPVNNQCLIEVIDEFSILAHSGGEQQRGIVRAVSVAGQHITASAAISFSVEEERDKLVEVKAWIGKTVRYALYADADSSKFTEDGKDYVLIPWYRILGIEPEDAKK